METKRKSVAPFYAAAVVWLAYALCFPLYKAGHFVLVTAASVAVFAVTAALCREKAAPAPKTAPKTEAKPKEETTGNPELDKMLKEGRMAIAEMKRLDDNIADIGISADIVRLEEISGRIFDEVKRDPKKLPQIRRFMDYYLPTTLKLLNAYDRAASAGISGENVDGTRTRVEAIMRNIVAAFEKQLDSLYGAEAMDISTDITVMETMLAREGLAGVQMKADTVPPRESDLDTDIKLEL